MTTKLDKNVREIIATGAGYGGCAYRRAKQVWYAVIKIDDAD